MTILTPVEPAAPQINEFAVRLLALQDMLHDQVLVSQDRCVDGLLDLYNAAPTVLLREMIGELISDIRFVSAVRAPALGRDLILLTANLNPN
jgi:hypothetical protein